LPHFAAIFEREKSMSILLKRASFALLLLFGLTFGGIVNAQMGDEPKKDEAKKLDLPWTIDDVKKSWAKGGTFKYKMVNNNAGEEVTTWMILTISDVNDKGWTEKTTTLDKDGKEQGTATTETKTWDKWGEDFKFTDKDTKVSEDKVKVEAGEFACKVYTQSHEEGGVKSEVKFYFAKDKPGYIVKVTSEATAMDKKYTMNMELTEVK
jgi:hypothetical protein